MLLQRLCEFSDRLDPTPSMYVPTPIKWLIDLDSGGKLLGFTVTQGKGGKNDRGKEFLAPNLLRSSGVRAKLLADNAEYVLGIARDSNGQSRVDRCHQAFREEVSRCAQQSGETAVQAVAHFLDWQSVHALDLPADFDSGQQLTFRVDGILPIDLPAVRSYWAVAAGADANDQDDHSPAGGFMECHICGEMRRPLKRLPLKIKPIPRGQKAGNALISANSPAFQSYGLEASLIAPTCFNCSERFSKSINALIKQKDSHLTIGPLVYIFWTKIPYTFNLGSLLSDPRPDDVRSLLSSASSGTGGAEQFDTTPFYATAFSASGARVAVRDWIDTTVSRAAQHLARYFRFQQLVDRDGSQGRPLGLFTLAASTVRDANRELSANVPKALFSLALQGRILPSWLLFQAVKRNRAEQAITRPRAALIKMVLLSQTPESFPENAMIQLDPANRDPAYLCGRLLAVVESVQRAAIPGANTTVTDRFFGTASSAPASVFGRLIRGCQPHLAKLRKEKRGTYEALQRRLEEVQGGLTGFPRTLNLVDQALFGLGYYHQRAADRAAAIAHSRPGDKEGSNDPDSGPVV